MICVKCPHCGAIKHVDDKECAGRKRPLCDRCYVMMRVVAPAKMPEPPRYKAIAPAAPELPTLDPIDAAAERSLRFRKENPVDWKTVAVSTAISLGATVLVAAATLVGIHLAKPYCPYCS
jgi:hypothetical protein